MLFRNRKQALLSLAIAFAMGGVIVTNAVAQSDSGSERRNRRSQKEQKAEVRYPEATRTEPKEKGSSKMSKKLGKLIDEFNESKFEEAKPLAAEILADSSANNYDKALAAFLAAQVAYNLDDNAGAEGFAKQAIELNGLDNNNHFTAMQFLAQLQIQDDKYADGLATIDRYLTETKSTKPEDLVIKGNALYRLERYKEAAATLRQAVDASPQPKNEWLQLLMASYADAGQNEDAIKLAEQLAAKSPDDKKAQMNLASVYMQADKMDKAAAILEKLRTSGQMTDEREYRQLYTTYANMEGKEKDTIAVINDGIQKGILKPDYQSYVALAQAYYYSDQIPQAIDAWKKGAPLSKDGETYLNLAKVLYQENRLPEAKEAAKSALAKGVKKPDDAKKIINAK
ncbi:tetratricopeptide repeat protein [Pseudoxanthomonas helianthi]|uniref:Tetratricopeptide repeat protein n=1 Tax=Pseudoxanthomonas helianthi TaxID=1453541 RepID=A0A940X0J3_9GAMM|nr:tetratricopeptide repeat protein [Pseudoxanthomonas helianthi]MBP3983918.1 tetratricopeptide repeat protein [Pseudoxanthomonas helianthi]